MPDSIPSLFCCLRRFRHDAEPRTRRSKAQEAAVAELLKKAEAALMAYKEGAGQ